MSKRNFFQEKRKGKTGSRVHAPRLQDRVSTHAKITDLGAEGIVKIGIDDIGPTTTYCLPLSDEAFSEVSDFSFRALLEKQYENWENALQAGAERSSIGDEDIIASHGFQEIYQALNALMECTTVAIGGLKVIYDTGISEIITVAAAHTRGYTDTFESGAADSDIFLVVHVTPDSALLDATYGVDIAHDTDFHGKLAVFGGQVVRDAPALDLQPGYNGTILPVTNTANSDVLGSWNTASFALPVFAGNSNPPCNDCLTFIDVPIPLPPVPPPPPPTGGGLPTLPPQPAPSPSINADIACSTIFEDIGYDLTAFFELISVSFKSYGNTALATTYPAPLGTAINTWITANVPDFDFSCDILQNIKLRLLLSLTDNGIFGFIPNPGGNNEKTPTIIRVISTSPRVYQDVFYFPIDRKQIEDVISGVAFPTYQENFYSDTHTIPIKQRDRISGDIGTANLAFVIDAGDYITSVSVTPLQLQMCGISYKKHQYLFHFDWLTDPIRVLTGPHTWVYDQYENARIEVPTGYVEPGTYIIQTDAVHGFDITPDLICPLDVAGTVAAVYGTIQCTHNHWGTTNLVDVFLRVYESGTLVATNDQTVQVDQALGVVNFALTATGTFLVGHTYQMSLQSGSFPDDTYHLGAYTGYIS